MSEPTVTMTLTQFKELESNAEALRAILLDKDKFSFVQTYRGMIFVKSPDHINEELVNQLKEAIDLRDHAIKDKNQLMQNWKDKYPKDFK